MISVLKILLSLMFLASSATFFYFTALILVDDILPAIRSGSLTVESTSTILNHDWVRNEIYLLAGIYLAAATGLLTAAILLARNILRKSKHVR